jgi:putative ABC transport system permease protein
MKISILLGRGFTEQGKKGASDVMMIDELFASRYWPGEDPIGKRIRPGGPGSNNPLITVVGVVGRVKMEGLDSDSNRVQAYQPYLQRPWTGLSVVIRSTAPDPSSLTASVRQEILALDGNQAVFNIRTMDRIWEESVTQRRLTTILLTIFACVALVLAAVGIYGVMAYSVTQRIHEIGIRIALGAARGDVLKLVVGQGMILAGIGVGLGLVGAVVLTRWMSTLLFGVGARDPLTFCVIAAALILVALTACLVPARRATKVDPMIALRYE